MTRISCSPRLRSPRPQFSGHALLNFNDLRRFTIHGSLGLNPAMRIGKRFLTDCELSGARYIFKSLERGLSDEECYEVLAK
jgi:hypothetical protein